MTGLIEKISITKRAIAVRVQKASNVISLNATPDIYKHIFLKKDPYLFL